MYDSRETFAWLSHNSREIFVRASHDSRETFEGMSHDVGANFDQFYSSQLSLEMVLCGIFVALCRSRKLPCDVFANICKGLATGSRHMRWFCDDFCRTKKYYMFKTLAKRSQRVRDACEDFAIPWERFGTVRDGLAKHSQTHRELVASQWDRGFFHLDYYGYSSSSTDLRIAVVSFWTKIKRNTE